MKKKISCLRECKHYIIIVCSVIFVAQYVRSFFVFLLCGGKRVKIEEKKNRILFMTDEWPSRDVFGQ